MKDRYCVCRQRLNHCSVSSALRDEGLAPISLSQSEKFSLEVFPKNSNGVDSCWRWGKEKLLKEGINAEIPAVFGKQKRDGGWNIYEKSRKSTTKAKSIWTETKFINEQGTIESGKLDMSGVLQFPKPLELMKQCISLASDDKDLVLDFFAGSGTTAHAVMELNAQGGGERRFITVQIPEECKKESVAYQRGYKTIFDITKERLLRASNQLTKECNNHKASLGFRIFEIVEDFRVEEDDKELTLSNLTMFDDVRLTDEQYQTLLTTWVLYDGSELTTPIYDIDLDGYTAHLCDRRLYMIAPDFSSKALKALLHKLDDTDDRDFDPNKIVYYANNFDSVKQMELNEALKSYANKKSIEIDVVVRN
ncbi:hypothetical protein NYD84_002790 [Vibrio cholerae]